MSKDLFKVEPVARYEKAHYFAAPVDEPRVEPADERPHPLMMFLTLVLVCGISVGLIGCYMRSEYVPGEPPDPQPDADPPDPPDCDDGEVRCADELTLETCESEEWVAENCHEICVEDLGYDGFSMGCDAEADDPCQCQYDIIDGDVDPCYPNELYCQDAETVVFCNDDWAPQNCNEFCNENYGIDSVSHGCDAENAENPCQCFDDILDGIMASCDPADVYCSDDWTVVTCEDGVETAHSCYDYCVETMGYDYYPEGCDAADPSDPCNCEYGMVDGGMIDCEPDDVICHDGETLGICEGLGGYTPYSCAEVCVEALGEGALTDGCDLTDPDDPCTCSLPDSGDDD